MPDVDLIKILVQYGLAGVLLWLYVKAVAKHEENWRDLTEKVTSEFRMMNEDSKLLIRECTTAFTQCIGMLKQLQRQVETWDGVERRETRKGRA